MNASHGRWKIGLLVFALACTAGGIGPNSGLEWTWADSGPQSEKTTIDVARLDRAMQGMVDELYAKGAESGAKGFQTKYVRLEGIGWESPQGDVVGNSPVGVLLNNRLEAALSTRSTVLSPEDADGAKGIFGTIVRGAFKIIETGVRVSLRLVDRNSGSALSEVTRELGFDFFPGLARSDMLPPAAGEAEALGMLVNKALEGDESDFELRVSTDRGDFGTYAIGQKLYILVESDQDCHVRVYHLAWEERQMTLIFPNKSDQNDVLRAGEVRRIPGESSTYAFEVTIPYGVDAIIAVGSLGPFGDEAALAAKWSGDSSLDDSYDEGYDENVEMEGDYLVESEVDEERVEEVVAKGLMLKHQQTSQDDVYESDESYTESDSSSYETGVPSGQEGKARATCYFVTVKAL